MNWCLWYGIQVPPVAHFFVGIGLLVLTYAIIRSRLFDIESIADLVQEAKLSAIGLMASSINHEVRNPLFIIKGLAETYLETVAEKDPATATDPGKARAKEYFEKTLKQAERALEIMRNFTNFAKRESGKVFKRETLRIGEVIGGIQPLVQGELELDKIEYIVNVPEDITVSGDRYSLEEVFLNLVVNACQAMPEGGKIAVKAAITPNTHPVCVWGKNGRAITRKPVIARSDEGATRQSPARQGMVKVTIQDTGPGLSYNQLQRIFEPFYTTKKGGVGLGLYVTKQLVERNGGRIQVHSKAGYGTTFTVSFPVCASDVEMGNERMA